MGTVFQEFHKTAEHFARRPFLHIPKEAASYYADSEFNLDYAEALEGIDKLADLYRAKGYGMGQRIAILLENRQEYFLHWLALNKLGCSVVPINGESQLDEIAYLLSHSESQIVVSVPDKVAKLDEVNKILERPLPRSSTSSSHSASRCRPPPLRRPARIPQTQTQTQTGSPVR